ncbi:MAG: phage tail protein [Actinomycetota bacterium]|nr:phage tail protein [Actinomycetota bacterium]
MPNVAANIAAGTPLSTGGVLIGALTATLPTTAVAATTGFTAAGYVGEDGVTESYDRSTEKVRAWGGDTVKVVQTEFGATYQFTFLETLNADVLKAVYGDANVTTTAATTTTSQLHAVKVTGQTLPHKRFIFELKDGYTKIRIAIPDGQITEVGEITYSDAEVIGYQVTVEAFSDSTGVNAYKYLDNGLSSTGTPV